MITFPFYQSISELQNFSQINSRMRFYLPRLKTIRRVHSVYVLYQKTISTTLDIQFFLFRVPSVLQTSIGMDSLQVLKQCLLTKALLIKTPVALELIRAYIERVWEMLVVSRTTERYRKVLLALRALIIEYGSSFFSYLWQ